jgi:hypothetical protein
MDRQQREHDRKEKERQIKASLDQQVQMAAQARQREKDEVKVIGARIQSDVETFEKEQLRNTQQQRDRKMNHQSEVTKQIDERKRLLKHIGSQVIVN